MRPRPTSLASLALGVSGVALAQSPVLLRDINLLPFAAPSSSPIDLRALPSGTYFAATYNNNYQLYVSAGAPGSSRLVAQVSPGRHSYPHDFVAVGSDVFFLADGTTGVRQVWVTDGTAAGTRAVTPSVGYFSPPALLTGMGSSAYFRASRSVFRVEAATPSVQEIIPNEFPEAMLMHGGELWLVATRGSDLALVRSDGTPAGTQLAALVPGERATSALVSSGSALYFRTQAGSLYRSDGTQAGTLRQAQLGATTGTELEVGAIGVCATGSDITAPGAAALLIDGGQGFVAVPLAPGTTRVHTLMPDGPRLFFVAEGSQSGLWVLDGLGAAPRFLSSLSTAPRTESSGVSVGGRVLFSFGAPGDGLLWTSDGTAAGTRSISSTAFGNRAEPTSITALPGTGVALFAGNTRHYGRELMRSDGTDLGTWMVDDLQFVPGSFGSTPRSFASVGKQSLFVADDGQHGAELWSTDDQQGAVLSRDIAPGLPASTPEGLTSDGYRVWFSADDGVHGRELWVSDGTPSGARLVADIVPGSAGSAPAEFVTLPDGRVLFRATDSNAGSELWVSDGTAAGTTLAVDLATGPLGSDPTALRRAGDRVVFGASVGGSTLWSTDGTAAGTFSLGVSDPSGNWRSFPGPRGLVMVAGRDAIGPAVYATDGTVAGTQLLARVDPVARVGAPIGRIDSVVKDGLVYFSGQTIEAGLEPWVSDGTPGGTRLLVDLIPGFSSHPGPFVALESEVVFGSWAGLYRTSGTAATTRVIDTSIVRMLEMVASGSRTAWLTALSSGNSAGLWRYDSASGTTTRLATIPILADLGMFSLSSGRLLLSMAQSSPPIGRELYGLATGATVRPVGRACGDAGRCEFTATDPVLGAAMRVRATDLSASAAVLVLGLPGSQPLWLPSGTCAIHIDVSLPYAVLYPNLIGGAFDVALPIPNLVELLDGRVVLQGLSASFGPLGLEVTGGLELTFGR